MENGIGTGCGGAEEPIYILTLLSHCNIVNEK